MKADAVTGAVDVKFGGKTVALRMTTSAYAYIEEESGADSAMDVIGEFLRIGSQNKIPYRLLVQIARGLLRAAKQDPDLVDDAEPAELARGVAACVLTALDLKTETEENPPEAAG